MPMRFQVARGGEFPEPYCHKALPRTPEEQFPNKSGKPNSIKQREAGFTGALIPGFVWGLVQGLGFSNIDPNSILGLKF